VVIPIVYSEKFYKDVLDPSLDDINKLSTSRTAGQRALCPSPVRPSALTSHLGFAAWHPQSQMPDHRLHVESP
jgi:hypothetical protein